ncbi:MAG TPA: type II secretion system F family protein [Methanomassiliicoccales archaeon]|nr:type II secretion system F family protein [Methanomassiliicoccales archaeon]
MALFFFIGFLDAIGGLETGLDWIDWVAIGLMAVCGPYGFYSTNQFKKTRQIESRLPDFLRDVSEGGRFGMTLAESIKVSSHGRYGSLTPEIQRMAAQIDWGVPATDAIKLFIDRVDTPLVRRMTSIVIKANDAGGNVADVLDMVAHDARETLLNRNERSIAMSTYTVVIYVAFAVFLATIFILNSTFLPRMVEAGTQISEDAPDIGGIPVQVQADVVPQVQLIFIISVVIHAFGDGILAGVLQDGRLSNGFRHSFIMLVLGLIGTRVLG